ncbi:hypothetical protein DOY81_009657 [Sarcophaga bullata]|nr:hypothetical protein DOY81_009657 [Sarcophaga bullata]
MENYTISIFTISIAISITQISSAFASTSAISLEINNHHSNNNYMVKRFEYIPTVQGYRFSYQLLDGTRREENAFITGLRMDNYSRLDSKTTDFTAVGVGGRPKMPLKNRKLSPGALKSLSG